MTTVGRNDSCPCGSGKKYKRCCLARDDEYQNRRRSLVQHVLDAGEHQHHDHHACAECGDQLDDIPDRLYHAIEERLRARDLEQAQILCDELRRRYPNGTDWMDRQAHIHADRGDYGVAADLFRRCLLLATARGADAHYLDYLADRLSHIETDHLSAPHLADDSIP